MKLFRLFSRTQKVSTPKQPGFFEQLENRQLMSTAPAAPTHLNATSASTSSIQLKWSDNSTRESGYKIERSTDGKKFSQINTVGKNVESYKAAGLTTGKKYYFR